MSVCRSLTPPSSPRSSGWRWKNWPGHWATHLLDALLLAPVSEDVNAEVTRQSKGGPDHLAGRVDSGEALLRTILDGSRGAELQLLLQPSAQQASMWSYQREEECASSGRRGPGCARPSRKGPLRSRDRISWARSSPAAHAKPSPLTVRHRSCRPPRYISLARAAATWTDVLPGHCPGARQLH